MEKVSFESCPLKTKEKLQEIVDKIEIQAKKRLGWDVAPYKGKKPETPKGKFKPILVYIYPNAKEGLKNTFVTSLYKTPWHLLRGLFRMNPYTAIPSIHFTGAWVYD